MRPDEPTNTVNQYDTVSLTGSAGASSWSLSYDGSDNLSGDGTRFFNHDTRNRLTGIAEPGQTTTYQYDVIGRRIGKSLNSGASWTGYVHAGGMAEPGAPPVQAPQDQWRGSGISFRVAACR